MSLNSLCSYQRADASSPKFEICAPGANSMIYGNRTHIKWRDSNDMNSERKSWCEKGELGTRTKRINSCREED